MKKPPGARAESAEDLRHRAERRLGSPPALSETECGEDERLIHELEVHKVELEMQNDELRAARTHLEAAVRRYTELFDFAPLGYVVLDAEGRIREANLAAARLFGTERSALPGRPFRSVLHGTGADEFARFLADALTRDPSDGTATMECDFGAPPAEPLRLRLTAAPLDDDGASALVALQDVTMLVRAREAIEREVVRKDEFLALLSHELRNPLAPIRNSLLVMDRVDPAGQRATNARRVIGRQVDQLTRIVDDLLDLTRIGHGKVQLRRVTVDFAELVRAAVADHAPTFEANGIALSADVPPGPCTVDADPARLNQVLGNILGNAAKFTPPGGAVDVALAREAACWRLSVTDSGIGFSSEVHEHLFTPFAQAHQGLDRSQGGLGLGLATAKGLVEMHGGSIEARSDGLDRGAEFDVRLPVARASAPDVEARHPLPGSTRRVLVIEDNVDSADSLKEVLDYVGHDVRVAYDGSAGLALARQFHPDIVICDIGLPGLNGYDVARALRADGETRAVRLIALSGYALVADREQSLAAGFDHHLAKPPDFDVLARLLA